MNYKKFENFWVAKLKTELKNFPGDFIGNIKTETIKMPGKVLIKGSQLFGSYEISDTGGNTFLQTENFYKFKYILYANYSTPEEIVIPHNEEKIKDVVKSYENYIDEIIKKIKKDFKKNFIDTKNIHTVTAKILSAFNIRRY